MSRLPNHDTIAITEEIRGYLAGLPNELVLEERIDEFRRSLTFLSTREEAIASFEAIFSTTKSQGRTHRPWPIQSIANIANPGDNTHLFRVREGKIREGVGGCWTLPPRRARANRLNRDGEPVLYTATSAEVGAGEAGMRDSGSEGRVYSIIVYQVKEDIGVVRIGHLPKITLKQRREGDAIALRKTGLTMEQLLDRDRRVKNIPEPDLLYADRGEVRKLELLNAIIRKAFSMQTPERRLQRRAYFITQEVTRKMFPLTIGLTGWQYPCVRKDEDDKNICLLAAQAKRKLHLREVVVVRSNGPVGLPTCLHSMKPQGRKLRKKSQSETWEYVTGRGTMWAPLWVLQGLGNIQEDEVYWPDRLADPP